MLTREKLDKLEPGTIFASGLDFDGENGIFYGIQGNCFAGLPFVEELMIGQFMLTKPVNLLKMSKSLVANSLSVRH
jgi:hypothetical protein